MLICEEQMVTGLAFVVAQVAALVTTAVVLPSLLRVSFATFNHSASVNVFERSGYLLRRTHHLCMSHLAEA